MSDTPSKPIPGERIAKVLARAGVASRRDAEKIIEEGRVSVNGRKVLSPALNVMPKDRIMLDGKELREAEPPRLWLYHKPAGLVTTTRDEKGRETIYDKLPPELPRVMSVGRLDLNSEGLLLLTNDGELKRKLELPETGWLRRYRVRVKGTASEQTLEPLRQGITVDGEEFQPMDVSFDRQQGANAWLTVGIREGKNREIRRAMEHIGLTVNRLLRLSYGPFRLNTLKPGEVQEIRNRVLRDQVGIELEDDRPKRNVERGGRPSGPRKEMSGRDMRDDRPKRDDRPRGGDRPQREDRPRRDDRPNRDGEQRGFGKPRGGDFNRGDRPQRDGKSFGDKPRGDRPNRDGKSFGDKPRGDRPNRDGKSFGGKPRGDRPHRDDRSRDERPKRDWSKDGKGERTREDRPRGDRPGGDKPKFDKPKQGRRDGEGGKSNFRSQGFKSHGGGKDGKPRSAGFKSHKRDDRSSKPGGKPKPRSRD